MSKALENVFKLNRIVDVKSFGAKGDGITDDTNAFKAAMLGGEKTIYLPPGTYLTDFGNPQYQPAMINNIPSKTHFVGAGEATVWRNYTPTSVVGGNSGRASLGCIGTDSGSVSIWTEDVSFRNIKFYGWSESDPTVDEGNCLVYLSSVKRVLFEKCYFVAPRGDAIIISSGFGGGPNFERHNFDITIRDCVFDGVNNKNRNAISVIDGDGVFIQNCVFRNFSDATMPGCIDFEPDEAYSIIKNAFVVNNNFSTCQGVRGHVVLNLGNSPNLQNIHIIGNAFSGNTAIAVDVYAASEPTISHNILVANNTATDCVSFFDHEFGSLWGVSIENNVSYSANNGGNITFGSGNSSRTHKNINISKNQMTGNSTLGLVLYDNVRTVQITNNIFEGFSQAHIRLGATGDNTSSEEVSIIGNDFRGTPANKVVLHQNTTKNALTNRFFSNFFASSVSHDFAATLTDNCGTTLNTFTTANLPSDFSYGQHTTAVSAGSILGSGTDFGLLKTYKQFSGDINYTWQEFKPITSANRDKIVYRNATSATTWSAWYTVTGV